MRDLYRNVMPAEEVRQSPPRFPAHDAPGGPMRDGGVLSIRKYEAPELRNMFPDRDVLPINRGFSELTKLADSLLALNKQPEEWYSSANRPISRWEQLPLKTHRQLFKPASSAAAVRAYFIRPTFRGLLDIKVGLTAITAAPGLFSSSAAGPGSKIEPASQHKAGIVFFTAAASIFTTYVLAHSAPRTFWDTMRDFGAVTPEMLSERADIRLDLPGLAALQVAAQSNQNMVRHLTGAAASLIAFSLVLASYQGVLVGAAFIAVAGGIHVNETAQAIQRIRAHGRGNGENDLRAIANGEGDITEHVDAWRQKVAEEANSPVAHPWATRIFASALGGAELTAGLSSRGNATAAQWVTANGMAGLVTFAEGTYNYRQLVASSIQVAGATMEIEAHLLRQQRNMAKRKFEESHRKLSLKIAPYTLG
ncbi:MAG: hypothetical protein EOO38_06230 [Cytophagaceae bacterium]|nr:MAG: hypothetical protein EOO38_06230 [Cytophagaceae bacterium]